MIKLRQWWEKQTLSTKLAQVLLPSVAIGTVCIMILLNLTLHASFLNTNNDVTGWGSLLIGSAIGTYITFAILFYSDASQKQISDIILRQASNSASRLKFATGQIRHNLSFCKDMMPTRYELKNYDKEEAEKDVKERGMNYFDQIHYVNQYLEDLRTIVELYGNDLRAEDAIQIHRLTDFTKLFSKEWDHADMALLSLSDRFHLHLDELFKKFPPIK